MKKLLLVREDHLGDLVLTTPLIQSLAENGYQVDVLVRKVNADILVNNPYVHSVFYIESIESSFPLRWFKVASWIRQRKYDVLVMPHARPKEMVYVAFFSFVPKRILMQAGILGRLTGNICLRSGQYENPRHYSEVWLDIARYLGIKELVHRPGIFLSKTEIDNGRTKLIDRFGDATVIGIHPGSAGNSCNLPFQEYGEFVRLLLQKTNYSIVITGSAREREQIEKWPEEVRTSERVWISAGELTLRDLSSVIAGLFVYVCSSTGPLHLANGVGARTFSPFCSRVGHSNLYWGNTNGLGKVVKIETEFCKTSISNCQFKDAYDANRLFTGFMESFPADVTK